MMTEDKLYASGKVEADFSFNDGVAEVFDDMLDRSIPYYRTVIDGLASLLARKLPAGSKVYDLGCSTGTTLLELARRLPEKHLHFIGVDNAPSMLEKAEKKAAMYSKSKMLHFQEGDITTTSLPDAAAIICNYTLQFLRPLTRQAFVNRLYQSLTPGGLFFLSEKTISPAAHLNRDFIEIYHQFKKNQGYSELEIAAKREALENVLIPFSVEENLALLQEAGFMEVELYFKWFNFTSFVAYKKEEYGTD